MKVTCPKCNRKYRTKYSKAEHEGATFDCRFCDTILITKDGVVKDLYKMLHNEDPRWPKDSKNAKSIEIVPDPEDMF